MELIYGSTNFYRLSNKGLGSSFNGYASKRQFVVTNEVFLPDYRDRRDAMGMLKDIITRETVTINEKFQPEVEYIDCCNYYFTSNHADALALEPNDRRFFVIEGPNERLSKSTYVAMDEWVRSAGGAAQILHYLQNNVDVKDFVPKGDAPMTKWKKQIIEMTRDPLGEYTERLIEDPDRIFMVNGAKPDLSLFRAEDLLKTFEHTYPKYYINVTVKRLAGMLASDRRIERRRVRLTEDSPLITLYAIFDRDKWKDARNKEWAQHYVGLSKQFAKYRREKSH
jgi:putative DNA primase/helicase